MVELAPRTWPTRTQSLLRHGQIRIQRCFREPLPHDSGLFERYEEGEQCGGCAYFAPFKADSGYVATSDHGIIWKRCLSTTCPVYVNEWVECTGAAVATLVSVRAAEVVLSG